MTHGRRTGNRQSSIPISSRARSTSAACPTGLLGDRRAVRVWTCRLPQSCQASHRPPRAKRGQARNHQPRRHPRLVGKCPTRQPGACHWRALRRRRPRHRRRRGSRVTQSTRARARITPTHPASAHRLRRASLSPVATHTSKEHCEQARARIGCALLRGLCRHSRRGAPEWACVRMEGWLSARPGAHRRDAVVVN